MICFPLDVIGANAPWFTAITDRQKAELTQQHADWSKQVTQRHMQQMEDLQAELRTHTELVALQQVSGAGSTQVYFY